MPSSGVGKFTNPTTVWGAALLLNPDADTALSASFGTSAYMRSLRGAADALALKALTNLDHAHDIRDYGAAGGGADDAAAISAAIDAAVAAGGGTVLIPPGTWRMATTITKSLTADVQLVGVGRPTIEIVSGAGSPVYLVLQADTADAALVLQANVARKGVSLAVDDASACAAGDVVYISTTVNAYSGGGPKVETHSIRSITGNTIYLNEPLLFSYQTTDAGLAIACYNRRSIHVEGIDFAITHAANDGAKLQLLRCNGVTVADCTLTDVDRTGATTTGLALGRNCNDLVRNMGIDGFSYGVEIATCRHTHIDHLTSYYCRGTPIAPGYWSADVYIRDLASWAANYALDCHAAFDVNVDGVIGHDLGVMTWQPQGGSMRNVRIISSSAAGNEQAIILGPQSYALIVDTGFYDEAASNLSFERVSIEYPNWDLTGSAYSFAVQAGARRVSWRDCDLHYVGHATGIEEVTADACRFHRFAVGTATAMYLSDCAITSVIAGVADTDDLALSLPTNGYAYLSNCHISGYHTVAFVGSGCTHHWGNCTITGCTSFASNNSYPNTCNLVNCTIDGLTNWYDAQGAGMRQVACTLSGGTPVPTGPALTVHRGLVGGADGSIRGTLLLWDGGGGNEPAYIRMHSPNGSTYYVFIEDDGTLKVHTAEPAANADGVVVGSQT